MIKSIFSGAITLFFLFCSCSNTEDVVSKEQYGSKMESSIEMKNFKEAMIVWTKSKQEAKQNKIAAFKGNDIIIKQATDLLLANGYTDAEIKQQLAENEDIVIAKAMRLFAEKSQVKP
jgi:hypothetical protein